MIQSYSNRIILSYVMTPLGPLYQNLTRGGKPPWFLRVGVALAPSDDCAWSAKSIPSSLSGRGTIRTRGPVVTIDRTVVCEDADLAPLTCQPSTTDVFHILHLFMSADSTWPPFLVFTLIRPCRPISGGRDSNSDWSVYWASAWSIRPPEAQRLRDFYAI